MKTKTIILFLFLLSLLCIGSFQPFGCLTDITGKVTNTSSQAINTATVSINAVGISSVTTVSTGMYTFEDVPYGDFIISAVKTGYIQSTTTISTSYFENGVFGKTIEVADIQLVAEEEEGEPPPSQTYSWQEIGTGSASGGGISNTSGESRFPSVAINGLGNPIVVWDDSDSGDSEIYIKQLNGTTWEEMGTGSASAGGISDNSGTSYNSSLAINGSGNPVVAWSDNTIALDNYEIYLKQWNGSSWEEIGSGSASGGGISDNTGYSYSPSLAINGSGNPVIAWDDSTSGYREIYIKQWSGSSWEEIGSGSASGGGLLSNNDGWSSRASLSMNGLGYPVVAWEDHSSGNPEIYIKQWDGDSWEEIGSGSASGGGISNTSGDSNAPSLSINNSGNPVVSWREETLNPDGDIYLKQWNGSSWEEIDGSATGGGISDSSGFKPRNELAINSSNTLFVTWNRGGLGGVDIKQWKGAGWEEVGEGSATGRGISSGSSTYPSIAINNLGNPVVTWSIGIGGNVYIKQYAPDN